MNSSSWKYMSWSESKRWLQISSINVSLPVLNTVSCIQSRGGRHWSQEKNIKHKNPRIGLNLIYNSTWESSVHPVALNQEHRLGCPKHECGVGHDYLPWSWWEIQVVSNQRDVDNAVVKLKSKFHWKNPKCKKIRTILAPMQRNMDHEGPSHVHYGLDWPFSMGILMMSTNLRKLPNLELILAVFNKEFSIENPIFTKPMVNFSSSQFP